MERRPPAFVRSLPFSEACERNKGPILEVLAHWLRKTAGIVLEIGSGTGQHAVHFARGLPGLSWQPTERLEHLATLRARIEVEGPANLLLPVELDLNHAHWSYGTDSVDAVFSANTLHIVSWREAQALFHGVGRVLRDDGYLLIYGPFRYAGQFTSHSNAVFDEALRQRDPLSGIRDFETVAVLAAEQGLALIEDRAMPAHNQTLVWRKVRS